MKQDKNNEQRIDVEFIEDEHDSVDDGIWLRVYDSAGLNKRFDNNKKLAKRKDDDLSH